MKFVGPVNSASMHCSREKSQPIRLKKKKKKEGNVNCQTQTSNNMDPNGHLDLEKSFRITFFF